MGNEVSGSESDILLSVSYLRAVTLAKMSERLHRLVYRHTLRATPSKYRPKCGKAQTIKIALLLHTSRL